MNEYLKDALSRGVNQAFSDVRFRTEFTDEKVLLSGQDLVDILTGQKGPAGQQTGLAQKLLKLAKPTLVLNSPAFGKKVWAPYGEASVQAPAMWRGKMKLWAFLGVAGLMGIGFGLGRLSARSKKKASEALKGLKRSER